MKGRREIKEAEESGVGEREERKDNQRGKKNKAVIGPEHAAGSCRSVGAEGSRTAERGEK